MGLNIKIGLHAGVSDASKGEFDFCQCRLKRQYEGANSIVYHCYHWALSELQQRTQRPLKKKARIQK